MQNASRSLALVSVIVSALAVACSGAPVDDDADHHDGDESAEEVGTSASALVASDPVSSAVSQACSTTAVKGLSTQLVDEIQCLKPGSMKRIDNTPGLALGSAVFPYLQTPAANALIAVQKARGQTLSVNSGLRTLPQQYLLYRWYQTGRCDIPLAAKPGRSNHESGIAVDIKDNAVWRATMQSKSFRWLGASDAVHFDYNGAGTFDMRGLSVLAFQRLWNRNNPNDKIAEDGAYGPATEARLAKSPVGGFPKGADCSKPMSGDAPPVPATPPQEGEPESVPDATEPGEEPAKTPETNSGYLPELGSPPPSATAGCALGSSRTVSGSGASAAVLALGALALVIARKRRR